MREREAFSPRDSILNATRNREKLSLQSRFYTQPPRLNEHAPGVPSTEMAVAQNNLKLKMAPQSPVLLSHFKNRHSLSGSLISGSVSLLLPAVFHWITLHCLKQCLLRLMVWFRLWVVSREVSGVLHSPF